MSIKQDVVVRNGKIVYERLSVLPMEGNIDNFFIHELLNEALCFINSYDFDTVTMIDSIKIEDDVYECVIIDHEEFEDLENEISQKYNINSEEYRNEINFRSDLEFLQKWQSNDRYYCIFHADEEKLNRIMEKI